MTGEAVVIGAGIGGLATAVALHQRGWQVNVHERAADLEPVGSGIGMAPNALRALDVIGIGDEVRARATRQAGIALRRSTGGVLAATNAEAFERAYGDTVMALTRAELIGFLRDRLPADCLHLSSEVRVLDHGSQDQPALLATPKGEVRADFVVAADGLRSPTRSTLFPDHPGPEYSGFTTWRTIVPAPAGPLPVGETWGSGAAVGVVPLADGLLYLYAAAHVPPGERAEDGDERAELLRRFGQWFDPIPQLLASAESERVLRHDVWELARPLRGFHRGRVALVGDAAHAMTPFQGQGACQAIEDAVVLAAELDRAEDWASLAGYSAARVSRTTTVAGRSRRVASLIAWRSAPAVALRNALMRCGGLLPEKSVVRAAAPMLDWAPPLRPARSAHPGGEDPMSTEKR
ncbi:FAD-dependent monooxygenase [Streptomyces sp. NPDC088752]|uniref:FAD-dependent monooxygenase n=1 Tax=Streptomyces sp. NPDC088752 TaxID=3154963 RepID=UPI00343F8FFC